MNLELGRLANSRVISGLEIGPLRLGWALLLHEAAGGKLGLPSPAHTWRETRGVNNSIPKECFVL